MPKLRSKDQPDGIRPFVFHGLDLQYEAGDNNATCECPFCGRENKFAVEIETSQFRCFVCDETGNAYSFLQKFWYLSYQATTAAEYEELARQSGFAFRDTANVFGCAKSVLTNEWLVPGFNINKQLTGLYRYAHFPAEKKYRLLPTPGMGHHLFNVHNYESKEVIDLCEGWRDAIVWLETTAVSELPERDVLAVPGVNSFKPSWCKLFAGKVVNILFDNDHPKRHPRTGDELPPAGLTGVKRVASTLASYSEPPKQINYLAWGENGYDNELPSGTDLRDYLRGV